MAAKMRKRAAKPAAPQPTAKRGRPSKGASKPKAPARAKSKPRTKGGRPSRYSADMAARALELCQNRGFSEAELAAELAIPRTTLRNWRERHPELDKAISLGRDLHDSEVVVRVERSLVQRAMGATVKTCMKETAPLMAKAGPVMGQDGKPMMGVTKREVIAEVPPDTAAARFVLSNLARDRYTDKKVLEHGGKITIEEALLSLGAANA